MTLKSVLLGAAVAAAALTTLAVPASAYVACNHEGDCWHTESRQSPPGVRFDYHPDDWYFHRRWEGDRYHYRDYHSGRGYYRNGIWLSL